jgi:hypothetical protein
MYGSDEKDIFCQIILLLSTAGTILLCFYFFEKGSFDASEFIVFERAKMKKIDEPRYH